ncbi:MAG: alkaline phosphatase family protein [Saprospiraceae bacterium]|nr:alkaline phosphatase family protein [Saprospiraceae bacterium]
MRTLFLSSLILFLASCGTKAPTTSVPDTFVTINDGLVSGPMVGYSTMREVVVWVQTEKEMGLNLKYLDEEGNTYISDVRRTDPSAGYTAKLVADEVLPGKNYTYQVWNGGEVLGEGTFQSQPLWQWRNDPPPFKFAMGSCTYINEPDFDRPGKPYGGDYEIFEAIAQEESDFMLWLGDNTYLREADWNSKTGIYHRYTHTRSIPELKELLANAHHYAIWDDHEFGPNNSDRSYHLKDITLKAFNDFWANPSSGINGKPGITTKFQWNDCEFFLLDNRYYRTSAERKTGEQFILGQEQVDWLIDNLVNSNASFKFVLVGGQFLNSAALYENHAVFAQERQSILDYFKVEQLDNVIFLTGDRHHSELSIFEEVGYPVIYDFTVSPLTSGSHDARDEGNKYQLEGSFVHQRNYGTIEVTGKWRQRQAHLKLFDKDGEQLWEYVIEQK